MTQNRGGSGLTKQPGFHLGISGKGRWQKLKSDPSTKIHIYSRIDLSHTSGTQPSAESVMAERRSFGRRRESTGRLRIRKWSVFGQSRVL